MTFAPAQRDTAGRLLPLQSYDETVRRAMHFITDTLPGWFLGDKQTLLDENGVKRPVYFFYSNLMYNGDVSKSDLDHFVSYPAFHHSLFIRTFIDFYRYTGETRYLDKARDLADWNISHSTPAKYPYGGMPYSTFEKGKPGGFRDGACIMTDKAAIMALAYLQLYGQTDEKRYRDAALLIGKKLAENQSPEGNWPFRVNPLTKEVKEEYTSSIIYAVELFEQLDRLEKGKRFLKNRDKALQWLMDGPVETLQWKGFYEDIPEQAGNRTNWDCIDAIRYFARNSKTHPEYLGTALKLCSFINDSIVTGDKTFLSTRHPYAPAHLCERICLQERRGDTFRSSATRRYPAKSVRSGGRTSSAAHGYAGPCQYPLRPAYARRSDRRIAAFSDEATTSVETLYDRYTGYCRRESEITVQHNILENMLLFAKNRDVFP